MVGDSKTIQFETDAVSELSFSADEAAAPVE